MLFEFLFLPSNQTLQHFWCKHSLLCSQNCSPTYCFMELPGEPCPSDERRQDHLVFGWPISAFSFFVAIIAKTSYFCLCQMHSSGEIPWNTLSVSLAFAPPETYALDTHSKKLYGSALRLASYKTNYPDFFKIPDLVSRIDKPGLSLSFMLVPWLFPKWRRKIDFFVF